ncbi:hypothetical protein N665_0450s0013 [Sinapis alba]|nr:hypothetical protein N665_0450s0013 [Sinapis alba]
MESRKNAEATLFRLSLADENKIIIGSVMIPEIVDLLEHEYPREKIYAAKTLFSLCLKHGNKGRAIRATIVAALVKILSVDEA